MVDLSPNKKRGRKPRAVTPVVDSAVRRSTRVRANSGGFKVNVCKVKNCLGCSNAPPTLSPSVLKEIGTSLCDLQAEQIGEDALLGKNKVEPVG